MESIILKELMNRYTYRGKPVKLHGIFQFATPIGAEAHIGGAPAGQVAYPVAVIEHKNGDIEKVHPDRLKRHDSLKGDKL